MPDTVTGSHAASIAPENTLGRYRLIERIGSDGMGEFFDNRR